MSAGLARDYLHELDAKVAEGVASLPGRFRRRQVARLVAAQQADGGFPGRQGGSDLYYTSFALRAFDVLGADEPKVLALAAAWLGQCKGKAVDAVDCFCLLSSVRALRHRGVGAAEAEAQQIASTLEACRAADGGYAKAEADRGSVYHTFLAALCWQMLGEAVPEGAKALGFVRSCQRPDGGFGDDVHEKTADAGGTNPTAAAVAVLTVLGELDETTAAAAAGFLAGMQRLDGGFAPHAAAPVGDLVSTFTALVSLGACGATGDVNRAQLGRFVKGLVVRDGGFRATAADDGVDVEYTYYGLGTLGLLSLETERGGCS